MKFNVKSRDGFTLIELLVVIGILAVLAAIAIPAVAGLIERVNVSADATNANEMTNAIERFVSEYELYCQDIASGTLDTNNLDAAQGRVYNVTKATVRSDIEALEKDADADEDTEGIAIYRDTKYPVNRLTAKTIIRNYTKTSSSTFEPKQSDCHYWYSPACGLVVCSDQNATVAKLNALVKSGKDAKGRDLDDVNEVWIDLTIDGDGVGNTTPNEPSTPSIDPTLNPSGVIPAGATYKQGSTTYKEGENFPNEVKDGDIYTFQDYEYGYNRYYSTGWSTNTAQNGWGVHVLLKTKNEYCAILESINGKPITSLAYTFKNCTRISNSPQIPSTVTILHESYYGCINLTVAPTIPIGVTDMFGTFQSCQSLTSMPLIPYGVTTTNQAFEYCTSLTNTTEIPGSVKTMYSMFQNCTSLVTAPKIADGVSEINMAFYNCTALKNVPDLPDSITSMGGAFQGCTALETFAKIPKRAGNLKSAFKDCISLTGTIVVEASPWSYDLCFSGTIKPIILTGPASQYTFNALVSTANNGNVTVAK